MNWKSIVEQEKQNLVKNPPQEDLTSEPVTYLTGENLRAEHVNSQGQGAEGIFLLLILTGLMSSPLLCDALFQLNMTEKVLPLMPFLLACSSPVWAIGIFMAVVGTKDTNKFGRLMENARDVAVPNLPVINEWYLTKNVRDNLAEKIENGETYEKIFQQEADKFLSLDK